ncbi:MAG: penicillin-binding protein 2 [Alphaproteobacteria bacterium]|jgi:penicillin-binding protein 2|nr:penicillin-binding protein 2 [Alphaproteobacteria bacterium]
MINNTERNKTFTRRLFILVWAKIFFVFILLSRLFYLQIFKHSKYVTLANSNRIKSFLVPPLRGKFIDKNGTILATNSDYYRILLNSSKNINIEATLTKLSKILNIPKKNFIYYKTLRKSSEGAILIYDDLNYNQVAIVEANSPNLPGIYIESAQRRYYPFGKTISNLLGYVATVSDFEKKKSNNSLLSHPDFKIGKIGLEQLYEHKLRGKAGISHIEVDAHGYVKRTTLPELSQKMIEGENINISIDIKLQEYVVNLTKDLRSSVVLIEVETGKVIAMTSTPSFDSNKFLSGIDTKTWNNLIHNPAKPLINKAVTAKYPPGSTFKIAVALAALSNGYNPNKKFNCTGKVRLGKRWFHCWKKKGHGEVDLAEAIEQSCNCYFYQMGHKIGIKNISEVAFNLGLGEKTSNEFYNEKKGNIPTKKWKKQNFNIPWVIGDTYNSSIGQGFIEVTNIQLAVMMARIITGKKTTPSITNNSNTEFTSLDYKSSDREYILKSLFNAVNNKKGTAYYSRIRNKNFQMSGKTGTAQVVSIDHDSEVEISELEKQNHGLFLGFAPFNKPKYSISIIVEHGKSGSASAAPIAKKIFKYVAKNYKS